MLRWIQVNHSRLKNFGKSILRILRSGGTIEAIRFDYLINESGYKLCSGQQVTGIFLACARPWALSKPPSAKLRCLLSKSALKIAQIIAISTTNIP